MVLRTELSDYYAERLAAMAPERQTRPNSWHHLVSWAISRWMLKFL